jgi:hypothetical protein
MFRVFKRIEVNSVAFSVYSVRQSQHTLEGNGTAHRLQRLFAWGKIPDNKSPRKMKRSTTTTALRVIKTASHHNKKPESNWYRSLSIGASAVMIGTGGAALWQSRGRPTRPAIVLLGAGSVLGLASYKSVSPKLLAAVIIGGTTAAVLSVHINDRREQEIQALFVEGRERLNFPDYIRFDDAGPNPHAVSRPRHEVIVPLHQALLEQKREQIKVEVSGYYVGMDGTLQRQAGWVCATRRYPWEKFDIVNVEMEGGGIHDGEYNSSSVLQPGFNVRQKLKAENT